MIRTDSYPIDTIAEIEAKNSGGGQFFFSKGAKQFFNSRIDPQVIAHRFFITTEKNGDEPRRATIRMVQDDGSICDVGEFQEFATPAAARKALLANLAKGVEVRNDPYEDVKLPDSPKGHNWRPFIGELPVGLRTSQWRAQRLGAQAKRPAHC